MKNIIFLLVFIISSSIFSQKLVKDEIDEFTGKHVKTTEWTTLNKKANLYSYIRYRYVS